MKIRDHPTPIFAIISRLPTFTASATGHGAGQPFAGAFTALHPQRRLHLQPSSPATYDRQNVMEEYERQKLPQNVLSSVGVTMTLSLSLGRA